MAEEKVTLEKLAERMDKGFQGVNQKIDHLASAVDEKIDGLALAVAKGFEGVDKRFDKAETRLDNLEQGQEAIKVRLDNVPHRFEVQELDKRLKVVETKVEV